MGRRRKRPPEDGGVDPRSLAAMLERYLESMRVLGYSEDTVDTRAKMLGRFNAWCEERAVHRLSEVTKPILERYQRHLYQYRQDNGQPLSWASQYAHIASLRSYFKWLAKQNLILFNPASELSLPRRSQQLPMHPLSVEEVERVLAQPDVKDPLGLRDRAILETFYSTGVRRSELAKLKLSDVDAGRGLLMVRLGKGRKDRVVPIGERALMWIDKYLLETRPQLVMRTDEEALSIGRDGEAFSLEYLTELVHGYIEAAALGRGGSCHLLRHTMATLMLEGGADIRYIQEMLGHEELRSTQIYTRVAVRALKKVHSATHPARLARGARPKAASTDEHDELLSSLAAEVEQEEDETDN
jgi:integrase/recombinase XerD